MPQTLYYILHNYDTINKLQSKPVPGEFKKVQKKISYLLQLKKRNLVQNENGALDFKNQ